MFEEGDAGGERGALVELPEEAGVVEAGAEDTLVAPADDGGVFVGEGDVGYGEEVGRLVCRMRASMAKYFWWSRITVTRTSSGSAR